MQQRKKIKEKKKENERETYTGGGRKDGNTKKLRNIICSCWLH
jgi:hypothetical protein